MNVKGALTQVSPIVPVTNLGNISGATNLPLGNNWQIGYLANITGNTTFTITGLTGLAHLSVIYLRMTYGGSYTIAFSNSINYVGGVSPEFSAGADAFMFMCWSASLIDGAHILVNPSVPA